VNKITKEGVQKEIDRFCIREHDLNIYVFDELGSTNQWIRDRLENDQIMLCVTNVQTAGRGREGRTWISPDGGIYLSFNYRVRPEQCDFAAISLIIGLVLVRVLRSEGVKNVSVKWPNDILINDSKLAGILIEAKKLNDSLQLVIGVGLNVHVSDRSVIPADINWSDLSDQCLGLSDRERLIALILCESKKVIPEFLKAGFGVFRDEWMDYDAYAGKEVKVLDQGKVVLSGVESGVDENGLLQVLSGGELLKVYSGDVSLRLNS